MSQKLLTELEKFINSKINDGRDKHIPFGLIPESLKEFWEEIYNQIKTTEELCGKKT